MEKTVTKCFCDICGKEIDGGFHSSHTLHGVMFLIKTKRYGAQEGGWINSELCHKCYRDTLLTIAENI